MNRRKFMAGVLSALPMIALSRNKGNEQAETTTFKYISDEFNTSIYIETMQAPFKVLHISDAHISLNSYDDQKYYEYSNRMYNAYVRTKHYKNGNLTTPFNCFTELLKMAENKQFDLLVLTGDIINYPSKDDVAAITDALGKCGVPYKYIAGNHDWHYEGMSESLEELRSIWIEKSLLPLYQGANPLYSNLVAGGVNHVFIDNSIYQILPEQLEFFKAQLAGKNPVALYVHIPIYAPGIKSIWYCGNPDWNAENDTIYTIERREQWPVEGNSKTTLNFIETIYTAGNLAGVFSGHMHHYTHIKYKGMNQYLALPAYDGRYRSIEFLPSMG